MKMTIVILLLFAATFIPIDNRKLISIVDPYRNEGYVAFIVNEKEPSTEDVKIPDTKCACEGTGVLTHGDGHKTTCPCKATGECKCGKVNPPAPPKPNTAGLNRKVLLFFTADWCGPCKSFKQQQLPKLEKKGMTVSNIDDDVETKMEIIDIDKDSTLYNKLKKERNSIPLFIILDKDNNEVASFVGYQDYGTIIRKWNEY